MACYIWDNNPTDCAFYWHNGFHIKTDAKDIVLGSELTSTTDTHYHFGNTSNLLSYRINRKTLFIETFGTDGKMVKDSFPIKNCVEFSILVDLIKNYILQI